MSKIICIWYAEDESGPAQLLRGRLARIMAPPVLADDLWVGDIVLIDRRPEDGDGWPRISRVVYRRYDARTALRFRDQEEASVLSSLLSIVGAQTAVFAPATDKKPGLMLVAYDAPLQPDLLAQSVGIPQEGSGGWCTCGQPDAPDHPPAGGPGENRGRDPGGDTTETPEKPR